MKWSQSHTVNTKMVINILLNDKISFQGPVKSVYYNEDDRNQPTITCSAKVAVWEFWSRIVSEGRHWKQAKSEGGLSLGSWGQSVLGLPLGGRGQLGYHQGSWHSTDFSPSFLPSTHYPSYLHPTQTHSLMSHLTALKKLSPPLPGILPHYCLKIPADLDKGHLLHAVKGRLLHAVKGYLLHAQETAASSRLYLL